MIVWGLLVVPTASLAKVRLIADKPTTGPVTAFALVSTQVSVRLAVPFPPPKMLMRSDRGLNTAPEGALAGGGPPVGVNCIQVGVPPSPFAFVRSHVSL